MCSVQNLLYLRLITSFKLNTSQFLSLTDRISSKLWSSVGYDFWERSIWKKSNVCKCIFNQITIINSVWKCKSSEMIYKHLTISASQFYSSICSLLLPFFLNKDIQGLSPKNTFNQFLFKALWSAMLKYNGFSFSLYHTIPHCVLISDYCLFMLLFRLK